jgi:hypothetical protein
VKLFDGLNSLAIVNRKFGGTIPTSETNKKKKNNKQKKKMEKKNKWERNYKT